MRYYQDIGLPAEVYDKYVPYISNLISKKVPVIFDFRHLAALLGRKPAYLSSVVNASGPHYRIFSIPKKSGGVRQIEAPYPALQECQEWIYREILSKVRLDKSAHGFCVRRSIVTNAKIHIGCDELLNLDLKDFFPSITMARVIRVFLNIGYTHNVSFYLASLCCLGGRLPQGAPTSPVVSNIVLSSLDRRLFTLSKREGLKYSRYADDLTFSGAYVPRWFASAVENIIQAAGFAVNERKTRMASKGSNRKIVTGIDVKKDRLAVPRIYRRTLRQEIFFIEKYGLQSHLSKKKIRDPDYLNRLIGKLRYWRYVEPDSEAADMGLGVIKRIASTIGR